LCLLFNQNLPISSKEAINWMSKILDKTCQSCFAIAQLKNKCCMDSLSLQNRHVGSSTFLRLLRLSLVRSLFLLISHRKYW
jgi:hypothetical protein